MVKFTDGDIQLLCNQDTMRSCIRNMQDAMYRLSDTVMSKTKAGKDIQFDAGVYEGVKAALTYLKERGNAKETEEGTESKETTGRN